MSEHEEILPGHGLHIDKMPGHWLLAQMGKRVLRPGGLELTRRMLDALNIAPTDRVVEFAPGLGVTAQLVLSQSPSSYTAVEADDAAARRVQSYLSGDNQRCVVGQAEQSGLPDGSATVVYCEAMLSMKPPENKVKIIQEAKRLLAPGGRCGIHELSVVPDDIDSVTRDAINRELAVHSCGGASADRIGMESAAGARRVHGQGAGHHPDVPARTVPDDPE